MEILCFNQCFTGFPLVLAGLIAVNGVLLSVVWRGLDIGFPTWFAFTAAATGMELWLVSGISRQIRRIRTQYRVTVRRRSPGDSPEPD